MVSVWFWSIWVQRKRSWPVVQESQPWTSRNARDASGSSSSFAAATISQQLSIRFGWFLDSRCDCSFARGNFLPIFIFLSILRPIEMQQWMWWRLLWSRWWWLGINLHLYDCLNSLAARILSSAVAVYSGCWQNLCIAFMTTGKFFNVVTHSSPWLTATHAEWREMLVAKKTKCWGGIP